MRVCRPHLARAVLDPRRLDSLAMQNAEVGCVSNIAKRSAIDFQIRRDSPRGQKTNEKYYECHPESICRRFGELIGLRFLA